MLSAFISFIIATSVWSAVPDSYDIENLKGHQIYTTDGRVLLLMNRIDFGLHGDVYEAKERLPNGEYSVTPIVVKMLDYHGDKTTTKYLSRAYADASTASQLAPQVFLQSDFVEIERGVDREAALIMPKIQSTLQNEVSSAQTLPEKLQLVSEVFDLFIQAGKVLSQSGYSHGYITLSDIGRVAGQGLRIYDYDSFSRTNSYIPLVISNDVAPEVSRYSATNAVSDFYSMGLALAKTALFSTYNTNYSLHETAELFWHLRASLGRNHPQAAEIHAIELFTLASLEQHPQQRKLALLNAINVITEKHLLSEQKISDLQDIAKTIETKKVTVGPLRTLSLMCMDLFSR